MELGLGTGVVVIRRPALFSYSPGVGGEARLATEGSYGLGQGFRQVSPQVFLTATVSERIF